MAQTNYQIVTGITLVDLATNVEAAQAAGWLVTGGVMRNGQDYAQAMYK